jgi:hypothetical protein
MKQIMKPSFKSTLNLVFFLIFFSVVCLGEDITNRRFMVTAGANLFNSASADYRQIYGKSVFMPEIKITGLVYKNFTAWGSFGFISKNSYIEEVAEPSKIQQTLLSFGVGYVHKFNASLRLRGELGMIFISFKEEALDETQKGSGLGWRIGANLDYFIGKRIFVTLTTAYSMASDEAQTGKIKLGGFQAGAGLGFVF